MSNVMTSKGHKILQRKLVALKQKREQLVEEMELARQEGDLAENSAYHQLRETVAMVNQQIGDLEVQLDDVKIVQNSNPNKVGVGVRVTVKVADKEKVLDVVGDGESDPLKGRISHRSPLGKQLMGKMVGDIVEITTPRGTSKYLIARIETIS